jgi:phosphoserine phosphatase
MSPDASELWRPIPRRRVYLMRHADVDYFDSAGRPVHPDHVSLTERGREQARAAARVLADVPFDGLITSGLPRTDQTAELVLADRDVPGGRDPRWREIETGKLTDFAALTPEQLRDAILGSLPLELSPDCRFLAGETFGQLQERVRAAWLDLVSAPAWHHFLIVSHGIVNRALLAWLMGAPLGVVGRLEQDACCINVIDIGADLVPLVRLVNFTPANPLKVGMNLSTIEGLARGFLRGKE